MSTGGKVPRVVGSEYLGLSTLVMGSQWDMV